MHGERDLLTRYVFPELRSRAMQHFINIYEIDLRWGITEDQSKLQKYVFGNFHDHTHQCRLDSTIFTT